MGGEGRDSCDPEGQRGESVSSLPASVLLDRGRLDSITRTGRFCLSGQDTGTTARLTICGV